MTDEERKERAKELRLKRAAENPEKIRTQQIKASARWRLKNPDKYRDLIARSSTRNKARRKEAKEAKAKIPKMTWKERNPEKVKEQKAKWYARYKEINKEKYPRTDAMRFAKQLRKKQRKAQDPIYAMSERLRNRLHIAFKNGGFKKQSRTEKMLGCSFKQFAKHIESQFTAGMSWDNRSEWHLDHIIPLSCATTIEGLEKLSHYTNIRPLWAADNLAKSDNLVLL
jgi:hypothetical protein